MNLKLFANAFDAAVKTIDETFYDPGFHGMSASQSQGRDEIVIEAPSATVFAVLQDSTLLHKWTPVVKSSNGKRETAGAVRECQVSMSGRDGYVTEECIECVPDRRIA